MKWFEEWFNSPYYHLLYQNRDDQEAAEFIHRLLENLDLPEQAHVLDLACGKGRHSRVMAEHPLQVDGIDLASESIAEAKKHESKNLHFAVHDMREVYKENYFHAIFNLFTSFGFFEEDSDTHASVKAIYSGLKDGGLLVIDFLNAVKVKNGLVKEEVKEIGNIIFHLERKVEDSVIIKDIRFTDEGREFHFQERVQALLLSHFKMFLGKNFTIKKVYGSYALEDFEELISPRLIIVAEKN